MSKTLVIMAAGMGSRFGGIKQIEPVGPNGEIIADYSVYDAVKAGFDKIVFIIRKEHLNYFEENITSKYKDKVKVEFAFQELDEIPDDVTLPVGRVKMLGTAHAIYCARNLIDGNFIVINADDFYGYNSFDIASKFFDEFNDSKEFLSVNYSFISTSSKNGKVKRGVVEVENGYIVKTIESEIGYENGKLIAHPLDESESFEIEEDQPVSMNFFALKPSLLPVLESKFMDFIHDDIDLKTEFLIPTVLSECVNEFDFKLKAATSSSKWAGITYKEDLDDVKNYIKELVDRGEYPNKLW